VSEVRLSTHIEVSALLARAAADGGFGAVLRRGDAERGSLLLLLAERGTVTSMLERLLQRDGSYAWESRAVTDSAALQQHVARATDRDPDLWIVELDIPSTERFTAEMS